MLFHFSVFQFPHPLYFLPLVFFVTCLLVCLLSGAVAWVFVGLFLCICLYNKLFSVGTVHLNCPIGIGSSLCQYNQTNKFFSSATLAHFISLDIAPHSTSSLLILCFSGNEQIKMSVLDTCYQPCKTLEVMVQSNQEHSPKRS